MFRPLAAALLFAGLVQAQIWAQADPRLAKASRKEQDGWILVHLEGKPSELGYQHGKLLAPEIDDAMKMLSGLVMGETGKDWAQYRKMAQTFFEPKLGDEYRAEIDGIVEGLRSRGYRYDRLDLLVLNGWFELAQYYLPMQAEKEKKGSGANKAPGNCSALIATGSFTKDGGILMAHSTWIDYAVGTRWRVAWDIRPASGERIVMDGFPGSIQSGDDFALNGAGILITETTITGFQGFKEGATPEFIRARRAAQYATSIDSFEKIMEEDSNGAYANTWLVGDLKSGEIAKLDLGLLHHHLWRTRDGAFVGSNFATDPELLKDETTFDTANPASSPNARKARWEQVMKEVKGSLDAPMAMKLLGEHVDAHLGKAVADRCSLCGHLERDAVACTEYGLAPFAPLGAISGKVTTTALAKDFSFWGRAGHPCGEAFDAAAFLEAHPEYRWESSFLQDAPSRPWSLVRFGK